MTIAPAPHAFGVWSGRDVLSGPAPVLVKPPAHELVIPAPATACQTEIAGRRGHTAEASRRVLTFSGDCSPRFCLPSRSRQAPHHGATGGKARFDLSACCLLS